MPGRPIPFLFLPPLFMLTEHNIFYITHLLLHGELDVCIYHNIKLKTYVAITLSLSKGLTYLQNHCISLRVFDQYEIDIEIKKFKFSHGGKILCIVATYK